MAQFSRVFDIRNQGKASTAEIENLLLEIELYLIFIWKLSDRSGEILEDLLKDPKFLTNLDYLLIVFKTKQHESYAVQLLRLAGIAMGVLRNAVSIVLLRERIIASHMDKVLSILSSMPVQVYESESRNDFTSFFYKEVAGFLTNAFVNEETLKKFGSHPAVLSTLLSVPILYFNNAKFVKVCIAGMINLSLDGTKFHCSSSF